MARATSYFCSIPSTDVAFSLNVLKILLVTSACLITLETKASIAAPAILGLCSIAADKAAPAVDAMVACTPLSKSENQVLEAETQTDLTSSHIRGSDVSRNESMNETTNLSNPPSKLEQKKT